MPDSEEYDRLVYKIIPTCDWEAACVAGVYTGSADDQRDGYIHFSTREQVRGTLARHFAGQDNLLLLAVVANDLDSSALKYETSRRGEKFPHLYGNLFPSAVEARYMIHLTEAGEHSVEF
ncbi:DUF952 domain-containing protein [Paremcibacter congregatus]|uniref:DUF952 domain-containing protein n=1 Tax=Paremcibacter congregatus TaxID=2043170 RepID=UPI0030EC21A2